MKFVSPKKCSRWTLIYIVSNLSRKCDYISVNTKIIFIPKLAQYMFSCGYIKIRYRKSMFVGRSAIKSIFTVFYQKRTVELD